MLRKALNAQLMMSRTMGKNETTKLDKNSEFTIGLWKSVIKDFPEPKMKKWLEEDIQHFIDAWDYICYSSPEGSRPWTNLYGSEVCPDIKLPDDPEMRNILWNL